MAFPNSFGSADHWISPVTRRNTKSLQAFSLFRIERFMVDEMFQWKYTAEVVIFLEYKIQGNPNLTIGEIVGMQVIIVIIMK